MPAQYTPAQKKYAKDHDLKLAAIYTGGLEFSGPVTQEEHIEITEFLLDFLKRRGARLKTEAANKPQ